MPWYVSLLVGVQVVCAAVIIILVLLQHGKGADMGAAFGSGASGSLFGATGSANFLSRSTAIAAAVFFVATIGLAYAANGVRASRGGVMSNLPASAAPSSSTDAAPPTGAGKTAATPADKPAEIPK